MMRIWNWILRFGWTIFLALGLLGVFFYFLPRCREYERLQHTKLALEEDNARREANIRQLETKRRRFAYDKDFVERIARELGMAKPGETIYKFNPETER